VYGWLDRHNTLGSYATKPAVYGDNERGRVLLVAERVKAGEVRLAGRGRGRSARWRGGGSGPGGSPWAGGGGGGGGGSGRGRWGVGGGGGGGGGSRRVRSRAYGLWSSEPM